MKKVKNNIDYQKINLITFICFSVIVKLNVILQNYIYLHLNK